MAFMNMFTHKNKSKYIYATPEAEPRGILLIKYLTSITNYLVIMQKIIFVYFQNMELKNNQNKLQLYKSYL